MSLINPRLIRRLIITDDLLKKNFKRNNITFDGKT